MRRREFVRYSAGMLTIGFPGTTARAAAVRTLQSTRVNPELSTTLRDPSVTAIALSAVDAARSAGAHYAAVRLTNTMRGAASSEETGPSQTVVLGLSVRAWVNGFWGWAATPVLSTDEAVRVAHQATAFATQTVSRSAPSAERARTELTTSQAVRGEWGTPVKLDPFALDPVELHLWLTGMAGQLSDICDARGAPKSSAWTQRSGLHCSVSATFQKQERLFASTDESFTLQTVVTIAPWNSVQYRDRSLSIPHYSGIEVQGGWEHIVETPLVELFEREMDRADAAPVPLPQRDLAIGRYDTVLSAEAMAQVLAATLGPATELDRALGYEANASGGSYLGPDPLQQLERPVASPLVTITADRSRPTGLATIKWDEEGQLPDDFTLVKGGVLRDYQTTCDQALWLAPWYAKHNRPICGHGCSMAPTALDEPLQHTPNLTLQPGAHAADTEMLIRDLDQGLLITGLQLTADWQSLQCFSPSIRAIEIRKGKRVSAVTSTMALVFDARQFWKNLMAIGGPESAVDCGSFASVKGDPQQGTSYSIHAVPARIQQLAIINATRRM